MLLFPQWRPEFPEQACRVPRWMPAEHFAPYLARPVVLPPLPPQIDDEDSSGGSSPERAGEGEGEGGAARCAWRACGARFPGVARLSAHVARAHAHAHRDGLFYCAWEGCARPQRGFNARYKMLVHVRTHTNERPHTCNQCQKSFSRAENLKIHLRSHSGEKPYVCPYEGCGKAYSNSSDRFKHTRTHTVDKPYCCKVPGCNKRYTDPSSLRKHVKTYKHFANEETKKESSDEINESFSPIREKSYSMMEPMSPLHGRMAVGCSPPRSTISPSIPPYNPVLPLAEPTMPSIAYSSSPIRYLTPVEPMYNMRVPSNEMSYIEYTQMYEHAYRNYYSNSVSYPGLRNRVIEKVYNYQETPSVDDVTMKEEKIIYDHKIRYEHEEMPLNLCAKRLECKPIEELVRRNDLPLDLSTKS